MFATWWHCFNHRSPCKLYVVFSPSRGFQFNDLYFCYSLQQLQTENCKSKSKLFLWFCLIKSHNQHDQWISKCDLQNSETFRDFTSSLIHKFSVKYALRWLTVIKGWFLGVFCGFFFFFAVYVLIFCHGWISHILCNCVSIML